MGATLDRVADHIEAARADLDAALLRFGEGNLHQSSLALRQARQRLNLSMTTIRNRGRS